MKRKLFFPCLFLAAVLAACGPSSPATSAPASGQPSAASSAPSAGTPEADRYIFAVSSADGFQVSINQDMAEVLAALGEPQSYFEAASCAFEGLDKTYTYSGFSITTRPDGESDFVNSILLLDDSVTTREGVYIGCSADDVTAAYGQGAADEGVISFTGNCSVLNFVLRDDSVVSIEYLPL